MLLRWFYLGFYLRWLRLRRRGPDAFRRRLMRRLHHPNRRVRGAGCLLPPRHVPRQPGRPRAEPGRAGDKGKKQRRHQDQEKHLIAASGGGITIIRRPPRQRRPGRVQDEQDTHKARVLRVVMDSEEYTVCRGASAARVQQLTHGGLWEQLAFARAQRCGRVARVPMAWRISALQTSAASVPAEAFIQAWCSSMAWRAVDVTRIAWVVPIKRIAVVPPLAPGRSQGDNLPG